MSSIDSQPVETPPSNPPLSEEQLDQAALREAMVLGENVRRLGRMIGLKSINRCLKIEDDAVRRDYTAQESISNDGGAAGGGEGTAAEDGAENEGEDDMENMVAGNQTINNYLPTPPAPAATTPPAEPPPAEPPAEPAPTTPAPPTAPSRLGNLATGALLGAALLGSGAGLGATSVWLLSPKVSVAAAKDINPEFDLLPPDARPSK